MPLGFPGALSCHTTPRSSAQRRTAIAVSRVPVPLTISGAGAVVGATADASVFGPAPPLVSSSERATRPAACWGDLAEAAGTLRLLVRSSPLRRASGPAWQRLRNRCVVRYHQLCVVRQPRRCVGQAAAFWPGKANDWSKARCSGGIPSVTDERPPWLAAVGRAPWPVLLRPEAGKPYWRSGRHRCIRLPPHSIRGFAERASGASGIGASQDRLAARPAARRCVLPHASTVAARSPAAAAFREAHEA